MANASYRNYQNVYIPVFTKHNKHEVPGGYVFITSVVAGESQGHIFKRNDSYVLCVSSDNAVSYYPRLERLMGFERKDILEIHNLINCFNNAEPNGTRITKRLRDISAENHYPPHSNQKISFSNTYKPQETFRFTTLRDSSLLLGVSHETLRKALLDKAESIANFRIIYS